MIVDVARCLQLIRRLHRDESGQDLLEYALVLITVLSAVVVGSHDLASLLANGMTDISSRITTILS